MKYVIACAIIKQELEQIRSGMAGISVRYLPQHLHRRPHVLKENLQNAIDHLPDDVGTLVIGFGLCSNAAAGIRAPEQGLYIPRTHDCTAFFLGSRELYHKVFREEPGTCYLTKSWIDHQKDPLGLIEHEYTERVGRELAEETMQYELKNYRRISYIHTSGEKEEHLKRARENAEYFGLEFREYEMNDTYIRKILFGPYDTPDFIYVKPNETIRQLEFFKQTGATPCK